MSLIGYRFPHMSYSYLHFRLRRFLRHPAIRLLLALVLIVDTLRVLSIYSAQNTARQRVPPETNKRIYIASQHWNTARLLRDRWNDALLALIERIGEENVFVAVYESGSMDDTKDALRELDVRLEERNVKRNITLSDISHKDEITKQPTDHGWIRLPDVDVLAGQPALRRIPFLATLRNYVLEPLEMLAKEGVYYDTVLFLNDVVFSPEDVLTLLSTNNGHYAAACSLDFATYPYYYDTFALRDSHGHETVSQIWPYFRSWPSRHAAEQFLPVPVSSCWNGMVAMPAAPFLPENNRLRFRGIPDSLAVSHVEGSECCLIHADNPDSSKEGVWMNTNVRVGYNGTSYDASNAEGALMSPVRIYLSLWYNRILRWTTTPFFKEWIVRRRVDRWEKETGNQERGAFCLINEMQVIHEKGWRHVQ